jgi:integrase
MAAKLDAEFVRTAPRPKKGSVTYWDNDPRLTGFGLRVHATGARSFFLNYRHAGRECRITIGPHPRWTLTAARERALALRKGIDKGEDPATDKRERRDAPTVQDLVDRYMRDHLPRKSQEPRRVADEHVMLAEIVRYLGKHTKVADIHGGDIADMHKRITETPGRHTGKRRPVRANKIVKICSKMFALSLVPLPGENAPWRNALLANPCKGTEYNHEEKRDRFFSEAELARIGAALAEYEGGAADCVRLIMLTGARPLEAMKATWDEFDNEPSYWVKPSAHVKQRKTHTVPLSPPAIELIDRLRKKRKGKWVFPGAVPGTHLQTLAHVWNFIVDRAELAAKNGHRARPYDLRHSFASVGAAGGLSLPIIGALLGHTQNSTTQRYAHLANDPLRAAAGKITAVITGADKPGAKVVGLKR